MGRRQAASESLTNALAVAEQRGERFYDAELYRLKGELALQQSQEAAKAESCFHNSLAIAQKQSAKSWELRAAMSLSRLWQKQGKKAEAHHLLSEIYHWFTEGFDTKDLQEAKRVLEELS